MRHAGWTLGLGVAALAVGCPSVPLSGPPAAAPGVRADDQVFLVQGCSGQLLVGMDTLRQGLRDGGLACPVTLHPWHMSRPFGYVIWNDEEYQLIERGARDLAEAIESWSRLHPAGRIHVIAQSAGTEVTRRALELLHPDCGVETVIFVGCATSPWRNLGPALRAVDGKLYNFYSVGDWPLLGLGTLLAGTMDRQYQAAAGLTGFHLPADISADDQLLYHHKLVQIPWDAELLSYGHQGHHVGGTAYRFARDYLSRLIAGQAPPAGRLQPGAVP